MAGGHDLIITGKALDAADNRFGSEFWKHLTEVCVFARLSPQQKEDLIRAIGGHVYNMEKRAYDDSKRDKKVLQHTLMCGDGGNDVGALKQADVGVALLTGFGNANVDVQSKKEDAPTMLSGLFEAITGEALKEKTSTDEEKSAEERLTKMKHDENTRLA